MHRADLLGVISSALPPDAVKLGRRCTEAVNHENGVTLEFSSGPPVRADVVVAADGIHSTLREQVTTARPPRESGLCAWRSLAPAAAAPPLARRPVQTLWLGHRHHLVHYPVRGGELVNIVAFSPAGPGHAESWSATGRAADLAAVDVPLHPSGWVQQRIHNPIRSAVSVPGIPHGDASSSGIVGW